VTTVLFCRDPLNPREVDEHLRPEAAAVRAAGGTVALLDHDALLRGDAVRVRADGPAWYRGWMIPTDRYAELAAAVELVVPPDAYARAHELPGWYPTFADLTPPSVWLPAAPGGPPAAAQLGAAAAALGHGPMIVKDYVKSRKHEWDEACFVPDPTALPRVVTRFVELQDEFLAGGIVVRAYERFEPGEARVWWLDGEPILTGPHPDTPASDPRPPLDEVAARVGRLGCRFVTTDLARRGDGVWRVVEVGDGQVSDRPRTVDPSAVVARLVQALA
jgi:hypothetical protein